VLGTLTSWTEDDQRTVFGGDPDVMVTGDTTVKVDASRARPVTASVDGVDTTTGAIGITFEQTGRRGITWTDLAYAWGSTGHLFAIPNDGAGVGTYRVYGGFTIDAANGDQYDLVHDYGNGIPADPAYRVTAAEKATLARIDQHFYRVDAPDSATTHTRHALSPAGWFLTTHDTGPLDGDRTDYVSPGVTYIDEAVWNNGNYATQEGLRTYAPGSRQEKTWLRQPLHADWYDDPSVSPSGCVPAQPRRTSGNMLVMLNSIIDQHDRFDCVSDGNSPEFGLSLSLQRNGQPVRSLASGWANFSVPREAADYRLTYDVDASKVMSASTHTSTSWTFRSTGSSGSASVPLPLLSIDYNLNQPSGTFTVKQARGVRTQTVTAFTVSTSLDGGKTWQAVQVACVGPGVYRATLPQPGAGQTVSLKVTAKADGGSGIEQTIIDAYR
jgi:hypothetical protein